MGITTEISWTDHTFNPWHGCTKVSPACDHCYAETFSRRVGFSETGSKFPIWGKDADRRFFGDKHWAEPLKWNKAAEKEGVRKRVFCGSMCDVMEDYNGDGHLVRENITESRRWLFDLIERTPSLDWLLLTKRPQNFRRFLPAAWIANPRPNVWGMTTVESKEFLWRATDLVNTPFAKRGLSMEPLLGPVSLRWAPWLPLSRYQSTNHLDGLRQLDWVIVGGESGHGARPMSSEWARSLRDECQEAGVAYHFKQWGEYCDYDNLPEDTWSRLDAAGIDPQSEPYRVGKKAAGRLLDGVEWNQIPEARP